MHDGGETGLPGRAVHRLRRLAVRSAAATLVLGLLALGLLALQRLGESHGLQRRFLMANPDTIPSDRALMRYALQRGERGYREHCARCHGADLQGDRSRGIPNLTDQDWLYGSGRIGEIERIILYGIRSGDSKAQNLASMPAFATANPYPRYRIEPLTPQEMRDITELLYSFQHPRDADPAAVERGTAIYHGKGFCFDCHSDHAKGDSAIGAPNLTDDIWLYGDGSRAAIYQLIAHGLSGVCPHWHGRLEPESIRAIAVYVHAHEARPP
jgi:cytochrome c oxidase cbb3-type subunit 3